MKDYMLFSNRLKFIYVSLLAGSLHHHLHKLKCEMHIIIFGIRGL